MLLPEGARAQESRDRAARLRTLDPGNKPFSDSPARLLTRRKSAENTDWSRDGKFRKGVGSYMEPASGLEPGTCG
jgi:hypothetical protein